MSINYNNRVAVITGAGSGLGRSHALFLAQRGAKVVVNDLGGSIQGVGESHSAADTVVKEIIDAGGIAVANYNSVADQAGAKAIIQTALDTFGGVDILVNNAGNNIESSFRKMSMEDFRAVLDVHLMGAVHCTQAAWQTMIDQAYGRIIMTTSSVGLFGGQGLSNYAAAKMALVGLMKSLVIEGKHRGILVNAVAPMAMTRMSEGAMDDKTGPLMRPEFVSAIVGLLAAEAHQGSGDIISTGAGYYAKVDILEASGAFFDTEKAPEPEALAQRFDEICDLSQAQPHANAFSSVANSMRGVLRRLRNK
ncbi:MAG: SDR family NAD(P)-dependent oxidoreductase [Pseudomonadales bacterium]|nr:SDR family NAD(P)-dependent oxidoreductase [Pseudomonadales bacterium]